MSEKENCSAALLLPVEFRIKEKRQRIIPLPLISVYTIALIECIILHHHFVYDRLNYFKRRSVKPGCLSVRIINCICDLFPCKTVDVFVFQDIAISPVFKLINCSRDLKPDCH